jgi:putative oxidoreductase
MPGGAGGFGTCRQKRGAPSGIKSGMSELSRTQTIVSWICQLAVAGILLQTLFFKFTGAEESVYIFKTVGAEPWGRIGSGIVELVAALLLLAPLTAPFGALLTMGVMAGAIGSHLVFLGIEVKGDGGLLFGLALTAFVGSAIVLAIRRGQVPFVGRLFEVA